MGTTAILPPKVPQLAKQKTIEVFDEIAAKDDGIIDRPSFLADHPIRLLGVRGYFRNTLGEPGVNDYNVYDDAIAIIRTFNGKTFVDWFNGNCDPSKAGFNPGVGKPYAQLVAGRVWPFRLGPHRGVPGYMRQLAEDEADLAHLETIFKDGRKSGHFEVRRVEELVHGVERGATQWGYYAINVHRGGLRGTTSWGCQTIHPDQCDRFFGLINNTVPGTRQGWSVPHGIVPYALTEQKLA